MIPKLICGNCGHDIASADSYCSSCGASIDWPETAGSSLRSGRTSKTTNLICPLCGQANESRSAFCDSCGARLGPASKSPSSPRLPPLKTLQSWKLTLGLAVLLIGTLTLLKSSRNDSPESLSPNSAGMVKEIQSLQKAVDANPRDAHSLLQLANLYHDVRVFPKAIAMYERYIEIDPSNADARVDLGTSYFEMSFEDTSRRGEYLAAAKQAMEKALTYVPRHQLALFNLGIVRFHTGEIEAALDSFKKCVLVDSTSETGRKAMQFLNQHSSINSSS